MCAAPNIFSVIDSSTEEMFEAPNIFSVNDFGINKNAGFSSVTILDNSIQKQAQNTGT